MNLLSKREIVSVQLFKVEISESELATYRQLLLYVLNNLKPQEVERLFGDEPAELEGLLDDVENIMEEAGLLNDEQKEAQKFDAPTRSDRPKARQPAIQY